MLLHFWSEGDSATTALTYFSKIGATEVTLTVKAPESPAWILPTSDSGARVIGNVYYTSGFVTNLLLEYVFCIFIF